MAERGVRLSQPFRLLEFCEWLDNEAGLAPALIIEPFAKFFVDCLADLAQSELDSI
jgi:hypothetical protein